MKTPREILLARHQAAERELDAVRRTTLAALANASAPADRAGWREILPAICLAPWRELILPSRRIWAGMAAVWVILLTLNLSQREHTGVVRPPVAIASWKIERQMENELFADRATPPDTDRPRNAAPRPRSEYFQIKAG